MAIIHALLVLLIPTLQITDHYYACALIQEDELRNLHWYLHTPPFTLWKQQIIITCVLNTCSIIDACECCLVS